MASTTPSTLCGLSAARRSSTLRSRRAGPTSTPCSRIRNCCVPQPSSYSRIMRGGSSARLEPKEEIMQKTLVVAASVASALVFGQTGVASAHHAVQNNFDVNQTIVRSGILTKIDWQNPHAWFHFTEVDASG